MNESIKTASPSKIAEWFERLIYAGNHKKTSWENIYHTVFSENVSGTIFNRFPDFDYFDPDATYERDVCSFMTDFIEYSKNYIENSERNILNFDEFEG